MSATLRQVLNVSKLLRGTINVKHFSKAISSDHVTTLNEQTLTGRILMYLNNDKSTKTSLLTEKTEIIKLVKYGIKHLRYYDTKQLIQILKALGNTDDMKIKNDLHIWINDLGNVLCDRKDELGVQDILEILHILMLIVPNRITELKVYHVIIEKLFDKSVVLPKEDLIQMMFYIGLLKKSPKAQFMLRKSLQSLNDSLIGDLTLEELCIVCNSTFKTSTKINSKIILDKVCKYISHNLHVLKDPALFITLIKTIRHNRLQTEDLLATVSCTIFFNQTLRYYSFSAMCHILALFSDYLYYDETLLREFTKVCFEELKRNNFVSKRSHLTDHLRGKDIVRFLWSLSNLNYNLDKNDIQKYVIPRVLERIKYGEFKDDPEPIVEIMLYLWMMNYRAYELVPYALSRKSVELIRGRKTSGKQRLNLLLTCIYVEDKTLFKKLDLHPTRQDEYNMDAQLRKRPLIRKVMDCLKIAPQNEINTFNATCQIPFINIIGITGYRKNIYKAVHVEILDTYTCLKNTDNKPTGLMQLKLRLLDQCQEGLIVLEEEEVDTLSQSDLQELLQDDVSLVC